MSEGLIGGLRPPGLETAWSFKEEDELIGESRAIDRVLGLLRSDETVEACELAVLDSHADYAPDDWSPAVAVRAVLRLIAGDPTDSEAAE